VSKESVGEARRIIEGFGYRVHLLNGGGMELKAGVERASTLKDLYKPGMSRGVELHIERVHAGRPSRLAHARNLSFHGVNMPVLRPTDLFLGQGMHLYRNVLCSQFSRAAHLIEFRRHVIARHDDGVFWKSLREQVSGDLATRVGLGAVILLATRVMGRFAPDAFTRWTVYQLPASAGLWVDLYGCRTVLTSFPGSKFYTLLQRELETAGTPSTESSWPPLIPRRMPPNITRGAANETLFARVKRYRSQLQYVLLRVRFHFMEGITCISASMSWRRYRKALPR
jgi:hypothetical protein